MKQHFLHVWGTGICIGTTLVLGSTSVSADWVDDGLVFHVDARAAGNDSANNWQALTGTDGTLYDLNSSGNMPSHVVDGDSFTHQVGGVDSTLPISYYQFSYTDNVGGGMVDFGANHLMDFDQDYTYEVFFKPAAPPAGQTAGRSFVFGNTMNNATGSAIRWRQRADDLILGRGIGEFEERDNVGTQKGKFTLTNGARWDPDTWLHMVVTHQAADPLTDASPVLKIYTTGLNSSGAFTGPAFIDVNEPQQGNSTLAAWFADEFDFVNQPNNTLSMGASDTPTNGSYSSDARQYFGGRIAMARIYDKVLTEAEILQNYESLSIVPTQGGPIDGDLDGDGFVGIADLNIVLGDWNQSPPTDPRADQSGDDFVGIEDLNIVLGNWNAGVPPTSGASVPEPASLIVMGLGGVACVRRRV